VALAAGGDGPEGFGAPVVLEDLSAGGFRLRLARQVARGEWLLVIAQVSQALVALRGRVLRVEPRQEGYCVAVAVTRYRFFSLLEVESSLAQSPRAAAEALE
jgi:hypothetical protein